ncbi:MAG: hypothetical protein JXJ20_00010 [Anaerolineae bacterium]|nr:hypothetical protein [Anaerolineae bacterium]
MHNDPLLPPLAPTAASLPTIHRSLKSTVRRVRIEHLATELLRQSEALRLPVPIVQVYTNPPPGLWYAGSNMLPPPPTNGTFYERMDTARSIAQLVDASQWEPSRRMIGRHPLSPGEIEIFAIALLMPAILLARMNNRQRTPAIIATIFQVPEMEAAVRLSELGYFAPG